MKGTVKAVPFLLHRILFVLNIPIGADDSVGPFLRIHRNCRFGSYTVTVPPAAHFFCLARKSGQKEALETNRIVPQATE